jgi:hypothetical protein
MFSRRRSVLVCAALALILGPALGQPEAEGPRPGKYRIFTIPTAKGIPLFLGSFVLEKGGRYQAYLPGDRMTGTGEYEYQPASKTVIWKTGPYQVEKWGGQFFVTREGKTHEIYLKSSTRATNSLDAK